MQAEVNQKLEAQESKLASIETTMQSILAHVTKAKEPVQQQE